MKGKMYRLTGTGLFGKHSNGRFGANTIPQPKKGGKLPTGKKSKLPAPNGDNAPPKSGKP